jgi:predicted site-specific integrase-resolvase
MDDINVKYLDVPATAEKFGVSRQIVYYHLKQGNIRYVRQGRWWAVDQESAARVLVSRQRFLQEVNAAAVAAQ